MKGEINLNLQQLKIFVLTAQTGKLVETAETLGIKQPTVTHHINRLQDSLGVELITQSPSRNWKLTDAGQALYHYALKIVHLADKSEELMKEYRSLQRGKVHLGASYTPASFILPPHLANFQNEHEEVYISLMVKKAPSILERVKNYELDLGVIAYGKLDDPDLNVIPVMEDELVLAMHPDHPLSSKKVMKTKDLADYSFILHEKKSVSRQLTDKWMRENNMNLKITMELGSIQTMKEATTSNIGLSIIPRLSIIREVKDGRLVAKQLPDYINERNIYIIYRSDQLFSTLMRTFTDFLTKSLKE